MKIEELIERDPEMNGGTPVFPGTRVPIARLFDHLESGAPLDSFLAQFPCVSREQALQILSASRQSLLNKLSNPQVKLEFMRNAMTDELFLADLNETMEDFGQADREEKIDDILTMERLARKP